MKRGFGLIEHRGGRLARYASGGSSRGLRVVVRAQVEARFNDRHCHACQRRVPVRMPNLLVFVERRDRERAAARDMSNCLMIRRTAPWQPENASATCSGPVWTPPEREYSILLTVLMRTPGRWCDGRARREAYFRSTRARHAVESDSRGLECQRCSPDGTALADTSRRRSKGK